jgi:eukaryotic-like serine/threonine-protein kinase
LKRLGRDTQSRGTAGIRPDVLETVPLEEKTVSRQERAAAADAALRQWPLAVGGLLTLLLVAGAFYWFLNRPAPGLPELQQRQLTTNSSEKAVYGGAISRDGKYLAYADPSGIHIKLLETGETQTIPQPEALKAKPVSWMIPPTWVNDTKFLANAVVPGDRPSMWMVSTMAVRPKKLRDDAFAWSVSWNGSMVAFTSNPDALGGREIWLMRLDGEEVRKLAEADSASFIRVEWSPDDQRVAYVKFENGHPRNSSSISKVAT